MMASVTAIVGCTFTGCSAIALSPNTTAYGGTLCVVDSGTVSDVATLLVPRRVHKQNLA